MISTDTHTHTQSTYVYTLIRTLRMVSAGKILNNVWDMLDLPTCELLASGLSKSIPSALL